MIHSVRNALMVYDSASLSGLTVRAQNWGWAGNGISRFKKFQKRGVEMKTFPCFVKLSLTVCLAVLPISVLAQSKQPSSTTTSTSSSLGEQETRGEGLFFSRCGLCHLPKQLKWKSPVMVPPATPSLSGLLKGAAPSKEAAVRQLIMKGTPNMPGFQYGLEPKELDDVIAYMKTL